VLQWLAQDRPRGAVDHCDARLALTRSLLDRDEVDAAAEEARLVVAQAMPVSHTLYEVLGRLALAEAEAARGDTGEALAEVERARHVLRVRSPGSDLRERIDAVDAALHLQCGDLRTAHRLATRLRPGPTRALLEARLESPARRLASGVLADIRPTTPRQSLERGVLVVDGLLRSRPAEAELHLVRIAEAADDLGLLRLLCAAGPDVLVLAQRLAPASAAVARLAAAVTREHLPAPGPVPEVRLSEGEVEMLLLLPQHRGNAELATALDVSVNTVKTRLRRLFAKLDVHDRDAAIRRAHELGVVPGAGAGATGGPDPLELPAPAPAQAPATGPAPGRVSEVAVVPGAVVPGAAGDPVSAPGGYS
jgi:LuxR family maltose regulon positive regulatory protein